MKDTSHLTKKNNQPTTKSSDKGKGKDDTQISVDIEVLSSITRRAFYYALEMIDIANNREVKEKGEPKVGGHPSACASSKHILAAIHLVLRKPEDYMAFKPHISPMDHAYNYLLHNFRHADGTLFTDEERKIPMRHLRHYSREGEPVFQSYHAEVDPDGYRYFPSGSVGIPPVNALYMALGYNFAKDHGFELNEDPTFWCLMGDSEFREGSLAEAMPDGGERELNNLVWIVDFNRQNLDGTRILNEKAFGGSDSDRIVRIAEANGWHGVKLKHGKLREQWFAMPGGDELESILDEKLTDFEFQALLAANNPELVRKRFLELSPKLKSRLAEVSDSELWAFYTNVGGHDLESLVEVLGAAQRRKDKPTLIVAYTIKGHGLDCQALSGNHSAMPESEELEEMSKQLQMDRQNPFLEFAADSAEEKYLAARREKLVPGIQKVIEQGNTRREKYRDLAKAIEWPVDFGVTALKFNPVAHTQWMWGQIAAKLDRLGRGLGDGGAKLTELETQWSKVAPFFLTMAPDVGSSTNTSPNMSGKLYGDIGQQDFEALYHAKDEKAPDIVPHTSEKTGHIRFEIAEGNCMSAAGSIGKFNHFTGLPFYPAMTIYDFFIKRALDQQYYNLYWHSHFATIGTPSGVTLAPEGAQHSWKSDIQIPNCVTWEPAFAKELEWILADTLRRHFTGEDSEREGATIRCVTKGLVQKDFLEYLKKQKRFEGQGEADIFEEIRKDVLQGGYCLIDYRDEDDYVPGDNAVHLFAMGALVAEAVKASNQLKGKGILANVFVVTSPDLLLGNFAEHDKYQHLKKRLGISGNLIIKKKELETKADWLSVQGARVPIVSVHDGEPGLLDNIGSIVGVKQKCLAVRKTSKSGTTWDIFHLHHIDAEGILDAVDEILTETAEEKFEITATNIE